MRRLPLRAKGKVMCGRSAENAVKWGCTPIQDKEDNACEYENH
ncbi:hypothetical protein CUS_7303 [Ruminococcus albus 8]|uniref:Uncharacterized protein n=1 Tax=Ruminococcus albus 8 TaxID=246199 RepID=E9S7S8_RUMAL|nr:hypothetical protein CUS_7303 [Ruminococcus albus 8]